MSVSPERDCSNTQGGNERPYNLEERTAQFGERVIVLAKGIPVTPVTKPLVGQLVRAAGSVGANYCEANNAQSKKDFRHKIFLCKKESRESMHWLRLIAAAHPPGADEARRLWQEGKELTLIFAASIRKLDS
jgi:four helix bundle protein